MNVKTTLLLLVVLAVVIAALIIVRGREGAPSTPDSRPGSAIFTTEELPAESIKRLRVELADAATIEVAKEGEQWWQVEPVRFPLNAWSVRDVLDSLAGLRALEAFEPGRGDNPDLAMVGLSPPAGTLTVSGKREGQVIQHTVLIGRGTSGRLYVKVDERPQVYVAASTLADDLRLKTVRQWRRTTLAGPSAGRADRVALHTTKLDIQLVKSDGRWRIEQPLRGPADPDAVESLLGSVNRIYIKEFIADAPPDAAVYGLQQPTLRLMVDAADPKVQAATPVENAVVQAGAMAETEPDDVADGREPTPASPEGEVTRTAEPAEAGSATAPASQAATVRYTLTVGAPADLQGDNYFATWSEGDAGGDVVFTIGQQDLARLQVSLDSLRDPRLTGTAAAEVSNLRIQRPGAETLDLVHGPEGWAFAVGGPTYRADEELAAQLVAQLTTARAKSYREQPPEGLPVAVINLTAVGREKPEVLRVWRAEAPAATQPATEPAPWLVMRGDEPTVYVVATDELPDLLQPASALRERAVLDLPAKDVVALTLRQAGGNVYELSRPMPATAPGSEDEAKTQPTGAPSQSWELSGGRKLDGQALERILKVLAPLRAVRWLDRPAPKDAPVELRIRTIDNREYGVLLDPQANEAALVSDRVAGDAFEPPAWLVEVFGAELRDTKVTAVGIEDVVQVSRTEQGQEPLVIRRDAQGQYVGSAAGELDAQAVAAMFRTLAALRVERFLDEPPQPQPDLTLSLEVQLASGERHELRLPAKPTTAASTPEAYAAGEPEAAGPPVPILLDGQWVKLDAGTLGRLIAPVVWAGGEQGAMK